MKQKILYLFILIAFVDCNKGYRIVETPKEYKNTVVVSKELYKSDSIKISNTLNKMVVNHEDFFYSYSPEFVDTTSSKVMVDTILYNKDKNKLYILVTIEYTAKEFRKEIEGELNILNNVTLYDGMGIILKRISDSTYKFKEYGIEVGNYESLENSKFRLKEIYFREIPTFKEIGYNRYNIDDMRMWDEPMWGKF